MGALWEIFEYGVDAILGMNMQKARNLEEYMEYSTLVWAFWTRCDLIVDAIGAFVVSLIGYLRLKRKGSKTPDFGDFTSNL